MNTHDSVDDFLSAGPFAVVGVSKDRAKYGNKVLRAYLQRGLEVYCVHPREKDVEGVPCFPSLAALPKTPRGVSIVTPPEVTERIVEEAARLGIKRLWMQPGAESPRALERARELGIDVIADGPCVLVSLRFRDV